VTIIDAPLTDVVVGSESFRWYDVQVTELQAFGKFEALFVDGPPQQKGNPRPARYPALSTLHPLLSDRLVVFVDDAGRETEKKLVELWQQQFKGFDAVWFDTVDGLCRMERK
jgi:hypothetical protein